MTTESVDPNVFIIRAKLAEQISRPNDMAKAMKQFVEAKDGELDNIEQRQLLLAAYKSIITPHRTNLHRLHLMASQGNFTEMQQTVLNEYCQQIQNEFRQICTELFQIIKRIMPKTTQPEDRVFFEKMLGDYYRYLAEIEVSGSNELNEVVENSKQAYENAMNIAEKSLEPLNATRLGLVLNFSVFYFEIVHSTKMACQLAQKELDLATAQLAADDAKSNDKKTADSQLVLELIRDNLQIWGAYEEKNNDDFDENSTEAMDKEKVEEPTVDA